MSVKSVPSGYHTVTAYLSVKGAAEAIEFYKRAFGATEVNRMNAPDGGIMHATIQIGDSRVMLADEFPEMGFQSPKALGGSPVMLHLYVPEVDKRIAQAIGAGAKLVREVKDQFYGDRSGGVEDPFGYQWFLATHIEDVSDAELAKRITAMGENQISDI